MKDYHLSTQHTSVHLQTAPSVFAPSAYGEHLAHNTYSSRNDSVIDIGTGSGLLAILAAKQGSNVFATDINNDAVALATSNAERNNVTISAHAGEYFGNHAGTFDVIIANLPQEIVHPDHQHTIGTQLATALAGGGEYGTEQLYRCIELLKQHMHALSRAYIPIYSFHPYHDTIAYLKKHFTARCISSATIPVKEYIYDNEDYYTNLAQQGTITLHTEGHKPRHAESHIYMLQTS